MKTKLSLISTSVVFLAVSSVLFSCRDQQPEPQTSNITVAAQIDSEGSNAFAPTTKAARTTDFISGDTFGLFMVPMQNTTTTVHNPLRPTGNYRDNVKFTHDGSNFILTDTKDAQYPNNLTKVDIYSISPYNLADANLGSLTQYPFTIQQNQSLAASVVQSDLLTASTFSKEPDNAAATLLFKHRLSRVYVSIVRPTTYKGIATSSIAVTAIKGTKSKALVNLFPTVSNDNTDVKPDPATSVADITPFTITTVSNIHSFEAILVPQATSALQIDFTLTTDGSATHSFTYTHPAEFTFASGKNHNINLKIENENVFLAGAPTITPWNTITLPAGDTPEMAANETFNLTANKGLAVAKAKVYCALENYTVNATYNSTTGLTSFKFNGIQSQAPSSYPYTITKIELLNAADAILQTITLTKTVSARTTSIVPLN